MNIRSLACLVLIHTLVDTYGQFITPLWPRLERTMDMEPWMLTVVFSTWQLATSVSQPLFGYWGDRFGGRWMVGLGPGLAIVCISFIGYAPNVFIITMLLALGGLGIGAFHPEAAVAVADAAGSKTTGAIAIFAFAGMVGLGLGPTVSGTLVENYGLTSLLWPMPPCLLLLLSLLILRPPVRHLPVANDKATGWRDILGGQWLSVATLLTVATLRVVPVMGVPLGLAFLLSQRNVTESEIGFTQSIFLLSGSLGTLVSPLISRPGRELAALVGTILPAAVGLSLLTQTQPALFYLGLIGSGFCLQGAMPLLISYAQRLLPRGRRVAASLTLGTSWGLGGLIVAGLQAHFSSIGRLEGMLWALVPFAVAAALGSWFLPRLDQIPDGIATRIPTFAK